MEARKKRIALRPHLEEVRRWVKQGKSDEWIASALGTSPSSVQSFRTRHEILRRPSRKYRKKPAQEEKPVRAYEGVLDHGERDGWGMWFDPSVAAEPIWRERWQSVDSVRVRIRRDAIVLEAARSAVPGSEEPKPEAVLTRAGSGGA